MIEVSHLTKRYGTHTAIADLSFHIEKGQIYGLLGPNGAGKSTTMNIMTGCLSASSGSVTVGGHDIFEEAGPAKRLLGYLPERPPLYLDRTPWEYLSFVGQAKGVAKEDLDEQIHHVMEVTRIADVSQRLIKNLSKGYQQRVGIAQALLGDPEVVILDEPTVGLDPKQIIEIRSLIRDLGHDNVYLVDADLLEDFSLGLYDIVSMESIPSMTDLTSVSIETTSGTLTLDYLEDSGLAYSDQYTWFWNQDGEETPLDTDLAEDLVSTVTGLTWNACVDYQADEDSLGTYGLDIPAATITVEYTESTQVETNETDENGDPIYETQETPATFVLELGDYDGDTCYARISGSSMVYRVNGTVADTLLAAKGEDLLPQDVVLMDWSDVTSVEINLDGTTYSLEKTVQEETDEDGNTTETYVYQLDGQTVDITDALDSIQDLAVTGSDTDATPGTEELSFTFYQDKENFPTVTLVFSQYDSSSCLVTLNGESRLLVSRTDLLDLVDTLQDLLAA